LPADPFVPFLFDGFLIFRQGFQCGLKILIQLMDQTGGNFFF